MSLTPSSHRGNCGSNAESLSPEEKNAKKDALQYTKDLEVRLQKEHTAEEEINKLLLLGAGESGKSTLFKQMVQIYGKGFPEAERKTFIPIIHNNIITSMKTLVQQSAEFGPVSDTAEAQAAQNFVDNELKGDEEVDAQVAQAITLLWADAGIQNTWANRSRYQLMDSAQYFFSKIDTVSEKSYIPNEQDILRCRVRTTGILENDFVIDGNQFKMLDVGGQRNERKKWIHCFEGVTAVLFVAAISEYDQLCYEDDKTNRMDEALNLFEEICNNRWFRDTSMILFLNKRDLFAEKLPRVPLVTYFNDYTGGDNIKLATEFLKLQFEKRNRQEKRVYTHVTCATDTGNIAAVFNAVKDIVIKKSLQAAGLV